jgi:catechol 2,3-dioxygenase-like lactoylglutathione lyase family enzyme
MVTARIDHVTAIVGDAERAASAIAKLLGLGPARSLALPGMDIRTLRVGGVELHLNAPTDDGPVRAFHERMGGAAYHHVALAVDDLDGALEVFRADGFATLGQPVVTAPGLREVFLDPAGTGGLLLQVVERREAGDVELDGSAVQRLAAQGTQRGER